MDSKKATNIGIVAWIDAGELMLASSPNPFLTSL
jgi:hypothetical protein